MFFKNEANVCWIERSCGFAGDVELLVNADSGDAVHLVTGWRAASLRECVAR